MLINDKILVVVPVEELVIPGVQVPVLSSLKKDSIFQLDQIDDIVKKESMYEFSKANHLVMGKNVRIGNIIINADPNTPIKSSYLKNTVHLIGKIARKDVNIKRVMGICRFVNTCRKKILNKSLTEIHIPEKYDII